MYTLKNKYGTFICTLDEYGGNIILLNSSGRPMGRGELDNKGGERSVRLLFHEGDLLGTLVFDPSGGGSIVFRSGSSVIATPVSDFTVPAAVDHLTGSAYRYSAPDQAPVQPPVQATRVAPVNATPPVSSLSGRFLDRFPKSRPAGTPGSARKYASWSTLIILLMGALSIMPNYPLRTRYITVFALWVVTALVSVIVLLRHRRETGMRPLFVFLCICSLIPSLRVAIVMISINDIAQGSILAALPLFALSAVPLFTVNLAFGILTRWFLRHEFGREADLTFLLLDYARANYTILLCAAISLLLGLEHPILGLISPIAVAVVATILTYVCYLPFRLLTNRRYRAVF